MVCHQPISKICSSNWIIFPKFRVKIPKNIWVATSYLVGWYDISNLSKSPQGPKVCPLIFASKGDINVANHVGQTHVYLSRHWISVTLGGFVFFERVDYQQIMWQNVIIIHLIHLALPFYIFYPTKLAITFPTKKKNSLLSKLPPQHPSGHLFGTQPYVWAEKKTSEFAHRFISKVPLAVISPL